MVRSSIESSERNRSRESKRKIVETNDLKKLSKKLTLKGKFVWVIKSRVETVRTSRHDRLKSYICESFPYAGHGYPWGKTDYRTATFYRLRKTLLSTYTASQLLRELHFFQAPTSKSHFILRISG